MNNITFIKDIYAPKEVQEDLRMDGIFLHAKNMSAKFFNNSNRKMTKKEVDIHIKFMYDRLMIENDLNTKEYLTA